MGLCPGAGSLTETPQALPQVTDSKDLPGRGTFLPRPQMPSRTLKAPGCFENSVPTPPRLGA